MFPAYFGVFLPINHPVNPSSGLLITQVESDELRAEKKNPPEYAEQYYTDNLGTDLHRGLV